MTELLRKARTTDAMARVAEYAVATFVAVMTGVALARVVVDRRARVVRHRLNPRPHHRVVGSVDHVGGEHRHPQ